MLPLNSSQIAAALLVQLPSEPASDPGATGIDFTPNTNGKLTFPDTDQLIKCRHISVQLVKDSLKKPTVEPDLRVFDAHSLADHVSVTTEKIFSHAVHCAKEKNLIDNDRLGQHLVNVLKSMQQDGVHSKSLLLLSMNHTMTINLYIEPDNGTETSYTVKFHDPNHTCVWLPSDTGSVDKISLDQVQQLTTRAFLKDAEQEYFGDSNTALLCPIDSEQFKQFEHPSFDPTAETASGITQIDFDIHTMNASHLYQILIAGNQENLADALELLKQIKKDHPRRFKSIVFGHDLNNTFLSNALRDNHQKILGSLKQLLALIDPQDRAEFLIAVNRDGMDVLCYAFESNRPDIFDAYLPLFEMVPPDDRAALLILKNRDGDDGLFVAHKNNSAAAVRAFYALLEKTPQQDRAAVLFAKSADHDDGMYYSLAQNHTAVIEAMGKVISLVQPEDRPQLLTAKTGMFTTDGLYKALIARHFSAVRAYGECVRQAPIEGRAELLSAKDSDGTDILYKALEEQDDDVIERYGELIEGVPLSDLPQLLMAKNATGEDGLYKALEGGAEEAITSYGKLLVRVSHADRLALLSAKNKAGTEGLDQAQKNGHADAIAAYQALLIEGD